MELIIDKNFLDNFYIKFDNENDFHLDIKSFFKKIKSYKLITNYNSIDELEVEAEKSNPFLHMLLETNVPDIKFVKELDEITFYNDGSPFKLFFIENEKFTSKIKDIGYCNISSFNIDRDWEVFYNNRNIDLYKLKTTKSKILERNERFEKWDDLSKYFGCFHSLIIADRYVLIDKKDQKIDNNLLPMLKYIIGNNRNNIDICIITREIGNNNIEDLYEKIKNYLENELSIKFNLSIIKEHKYMKPKFQHFRRIYTNYSYVEVDNSFNVFKNNGNFDDDNRIITFNSVFNDKNYRFVMKELIDIKNWLRKVENRPKIGYGSYKKNKMLEMIKEK